MLDTSKLFWSAFREQRLGFMFSTIMVILVYIGSLAIAAQAALWRTSVSWGHDLQSRMTVELPFIAGESQKKRLELTHQLIKELSSLPEVSSNIKIVSDEEKEGLLKSWVKDEELLELLPMPTLLDIELKMGAKITGEELRKKLSLTFKNAYVHSHADWMDKLDGFLEVLGFLAGFMLILTALVLVVVIMVICRAALSVQRHTIELLHYMGASDALIAGQFQKHIQRLAVPCSLLGYLLACVTVIFLVILLGSMDGLSLIAPLSWFTIASVMTLVPLGAVALALLSARISVQKQLAL